MNQLSAQVSGDAGTSSYLLENIRAAYTLSGALEEDHRQLRMLEDEVNQNAIIIDRALQSLNNEINRQAEYITSERTALVQLASDINVGQSFTTPTRRASAAAAAPRRAPMRPSIWWRLPPTTPHRRSLGVMPMPCSSP